jgi:hypothetical protein
LRRTFFFGLAVAPPAAVAFDVFAVVMVVVVAAAAAAAADGPGAAGACGPGAGGMFDIFSLELLRSRLETIQLTERSILPRRLTGKVEERGSVR